MNLYTIFDENHISQSSVEDIKMPCMQFSRNINLRLILLCFGNDQLLLALISQSCVEDK